MDDPGRLECRLSGVEPAGPGALAGRLGRWTAHVSADAAGRRADGLVRDDVLSGAAQPLAATTQGRRQEARTTAATAGTLGPAQGLSAVRRAVPPRPDSV